MRLPALLACAALAGAALPVSGCGSAGAGSGAGKKVVVAAF